MRIAFDTNILAYMAGVEKVPEDSSKIEASRVVHAKLAEVNECVAPLQALGELYVVLSRFSGDRDSAREIVEEFRDQFEPAPSNPDSFDSALTLASGHKLQFWDALILSAAADSGCSLLLSEDLQPGFTWRGVRVVNPFAVKMDVRLKRVMGEE
jgi:predicted nucleic acid-binding protein